MKPSSKELTEKLRDRWIKLLRMKASDYEHIARKNGEQVTEPSIDDICNEIDAFFAGFIH
jgi:cell fate (sporulation/competence/biofilm development) regulator YmcA (YheA/YmcA/DUF963 family)